MKKILATGCGGMLGKAIYDVFSKDFELRGTATDIDVNDSWLSYLDVRDYGAVRKAVEEFKPDMIFHLAALTDLEYCEKNPDEAYRTNAIGTENVALLAKELKIPMVYISTAGIFDGTKHVYDDYDTPNPLSHYGRSKYMGELFVKTTLDKFFVFRAGWMMGSGAKDKKFIPKIINQIKEGKTELKAIDDIFGTPTYTYDLAKNIREVIKTPYYGVYNMVCNGGAVSRYEVTAEILKILGLTEKIKLTSVPTSYFDGTFFAPRPPSEAMINRKLTLRGLNLMRDWRKCLKEYLEQDWKEFFNKK